MAAPALDSDASVAIEQLYRFGESLNESKEKSEVLEGSDCVTVFVSGRILGLSLVGCGVWVDRWVVSVGL